MSRRTFVTRGFFAVFVGMLLFYGSLALIFRALGSGLWLIAAIAYAASLLIAIIWIVAAITVKRLHDRDRSGWLVFVLLVPVVSWWINIETFFLRGTAKENSYGPPSSNGSESISAAIALGLAALLVPSIIPISMRSLVVQPFNIPSGAQEPTLFIGDYIFVSKSAYGYSHYSFPLGLIPFSGRIFASEPTRGDVVVFKFPGDNRTDYIKRLVGLPGDRVQMKDGVLYINEQAVPKVRVDDYIDSDFGGTTHHVPKYRESLPNGVSYEVLDLEPDGDLDNTQVFVVPAGHYFMMGDNRDNSSDSRGSVGYVPFENLVGKAEVIFYSIDGSTPFWQFWRKPAETRVERIGARIH